MFMFDIKKCIFESNLVCIICTNDTLTLV